MAPDESELAPGVTSLPEALSLAVAWLDGGAPPPAADGGGKSGADGDNDASTQQQTPIEKAIALLDKLQLQISRSGLFSKNESLDDVPTSSLELMGVEYQLARAHLMLPTHSAPPASGAADNGGSSNGGATGLSPSLMRKRNVMRAVEYYHSFLKRMEQLGEDVLPEATLKEYHALCPSP